MTNQIYTTAKGKKIDMGSLILKNESTVAVGNYRVNSRGDEIGPGGQIVRTREQVLQDYYDQNPRDI